MKKAWRILAWLVPVICIALVVTLLLFLEQVDLEYTCEWDEVCEIKRYVWMPLVPLIPLALWNFFRQLWWPGMLLALYLAYVGSEVLDLVPAHYWGPYGNEASLTALAGYAMFLVAIIGFFPAYGCGKASAISGVIMLIVIALYVIEPIPLPL